MTPLLVLFTKMTVPAVNSIDQISAHNPYKRHPNCKKLPSKYYILKAILLARDNLKSNETRCMALPHIDLFVKEGSNA